MIKYRKNDCFEFFAELVTEVEYLKDPTKVIYETISKGCEKRQIDMKKVDIDIVDTSKIYRNNYTLLLSVKCAIMQTK